MAEKNPTGGDPGNTSEGLSGVARRLASRLHFPSYEKRRLRQLKKSPQWAREMTANMRVGNAEMMAVSERLFRERVQQECDTLQEKLDGKARGSEPQRSQCSSARYPEIPYSCPTCGCKSQVAA